MAHSTKKEPIVTVFLKRDQEPEPKPRNNFGGGSFGVKPSFTETFNLIAPIVDFDRNGKPLMKHVDKASHPQLSALLVKDAHPSEVLRSHEKVDVHKPGAFRWIHVPVTKIDWAEMVVRNVLNEPRIASKSYKKDQQPELAGWMFDKDRWEKQQRGNEKFHPIYAQYLQPNIWKYPQGNCALFMPYLHMDNARSNQLRNETIKWTLNKGKKAQPLLPKPHPDHLEDPDCAENSEDPKYIGSRLIARYLYHGAGNCEGGGNLHIRRSLDQFHYNTADNTDKRDVDQVVYNYTRKYMHDLGLKEPLVMMVDQIWLWVLPDASIPTVVTCFPSMFQKSATGSLAFRSSDLFRLVLEDLSNESMPDRRVESAADLAVMIVKQASGVFVCKTLRSRHQFFGMFDDAIAEFAWKQAEAWESFVDNFGEQTERKKKARLDKQLQEKELEKTLGKENTETECEDDKASSYTASIIPGTEQKKKGAKSENNQSKDFDERLSIKKDIDLVREIRDILDELNIISSVIDDQKPVITDFGEFIMPDESPGNTCEEKHHPLKFVEKIEKHVEKMKTSATREYDELKHILDLKQQQTSIALAEETSRQGSTVLLFTFITGVFLPPSFFTSLFGMDILGGVKTSTVIAIMIPTSCILIAVSIFAGIYINFYDRWFKGNKPARNDKPPILERESPRQRRFSTLRLTKTRSSSFYSA